MTGLRDLDTTSADRQLLTLGFDDASRCTAPSLRGVTDPPAHGHECVGATSDGDRASHFRHGSSRDRIGATCGSVPSRHGGRPAGRYADSRRCGADPRSRVPPTPAQNLLMRGGLREIRRQSAQSTRQQAAGRRAGFALTAVKAPVAPSLNYVAPSSPSGRPSRRRGRPRSSPPFTRATRIRPRASRRASRLAA